MRILLLQRGPATGTAYQSEPTRNDREDVLLAMRRNGDDLDADCGGPLRLLVPHLYAWKSCKWTRCTPGVVSGRDR